MAKESGLGARLFVDGYNISGDVGAVSRIGGSHEELDVTGIDKSAKERLLGVRDGAIEFTSYFNDATTSGAEGVFTALKSLPTTDRIVSYFHRATRGAAAASLVSKQMNYDFERAEDGALTAETSAAANGYGLEWGVAATAGVRTDTTATNGASIDFGTGSTAFGLQAYLHVFTFAGTSCTVTLEGSSDDGGGDAFAAITGGAFTAATGKTSQRIATAAGQTIERYLRVVTSGTFTDCSFAVVVVRNDTAVTF